MLAHWNGVMSTLSSLCIVLLWLANEERPNFKVRCEEMFTSSLNGHTTGQGLSVEISGLVDWFGIGRSSLIGWEQALPLGMLQNGVVAEVVLVRGLNAEGSLCSHAAHCLAYI